MMLLIFILISINISAQTDWEKWDKAETDYRLPGKVTHRDYSFDSENFSRSLVKSFANAYWFFISDVDGDNCPFRPSCSAFFVEAVKETNIFKGTLMFFDRFTRDVNIFKKNKYPHTNHSYFYDPINLYTLHPGLIEYIPPGEVIDFE
jgi:putative component of membrane protein insertase Oxa1/YidC/SpoIIIJ protein YidD